MNKTSILTTNEIELHPVLPHNNNFKLKYIKKVCFYFLSKQLVNYGGENVLIIFHYFYCPCPLLLLLFGRLFPRTSGQISPRLQSAHDANDPISPFSECKVHEIYSRVVANFKQNVQYE